MYYAKVQSRNYLSVGNLWDFFGHISDGKREELIMALISTA
jgi:hypothetical protein